MTELNIWQILWESGFVVKMVLVILLFSSILSWGIVWQKYRELKFIREANDKFLHFFSKSESLTDIQKEASENTLSTMSLIFKKGISELDKIKENLSQAGRQETSKHFETHGFQALERSMKAGFNQANEKMDHMVSFLATIGSITPFIGLFGTVWGIIDAFSGLSQGGGSIEAVAPGIAEALVATAVGLAAAIPAVIFYNIFSSQISTLNSQMEAFSQDFLNLLERNLLITKDDI